MLSTTSSDSDELPLETGEPPRADLYTAGRGSGKPCPRPAAGPPGPDPDPPPPPHSVAAAAAAAALSAPRGAAGAREPRLRVHARSHWADGDALADAYAVGATTSTGWRGEQEAEAEEGTGPSLRLELGLDLLLGHQKGIAFWCSVPPSGSGSGSSIPEAREGGDRYAQGATAAAAAATLRVHDYERLRSAAPRCAFGSCLRCARVCRAVRVRCAGVRAGRRVNATLQGRGTLSLLMWKCGSTGVWWSSIVCDLVGFFAVTARAGSRWLRGHIIV